MARLTFSMAVSSYRFVVIESMKRQVDAYFEHAGEKYRVECKGEDQSIKAEAIDKFFMSLDAAGISGLFVSMSGLTCPQRPLPGCTGRKGLFSS